MKQRWKLGGQNVDGKREVNEPSMSHEGAKTVRSKCKSKWVDFYRENPTRAKAEENPTTAGFLLNERKKSITRRHQNICTLLSVHAVGIKILFRLGAGRCF